MIWVRRYGVHANINLVYSAEFFPSFAIYEYIRLCILLNLSVFYLGFLYPISL